MLKSVGASLWYACFCGEDCRGSGFPGDLEGPVEHEVFYLVGGGRSALWSLCMIP